MSELTEEGEQGRDFFRRAVRKNHPTMAIGSFA